MEAIATAPAPQHMRALQQANRVRLARATEKYTDLFNVASGVMEEPAVVDARKDAEAKQEELDRLAGLGIHQQGLGVT